MVGVVRAATVCVVVGICDRPLEARRAGASSIEANEASRHGYSEIKASEVRRGWGRRLYDILGG